jgi:hypothetical protein
MPPPYGYAPPMMPGGVPHYAAAPTAPGAPLAAVAPRGPTLSAAPTVASAAGAAAAVPGSLNAPPPQPLFPIGAPPPTAAASTPGYTTTPTPTPTAAAAAAVDTVCLIYGDDEVSMVRTCFLYLSTPAHLSWVGEGRLQQLSAPYPPNTPRRCTYDGLMRT